MAEHDVDRVKTLFQDTDLEDVPVTRDLIGPAVAWGSGRRRRDRWMATGAAGALAAVAVVGAVAFRPHGGTSGSVAAGSAPKGSNSPATEQPAHRQQELLDSLLPYFPAGYRLACQTPDPEGGSCPVLTISSPTGTSIVQWGIGALMIESGPADAEYRHEHKATAQIPLVSGTRAVPEGVVTIRETDSEAQVNFADKTMLVDPTDLAFNEAQYAFTPTGSPIGFHIELFQMVKDIPWKDGKSGTGGMDRELWGYNPTGPVLSPEQFAKLASAPVFKTVVEELSPSYVPSEPTSS